MQFGTQFLVQVVAFQAGLRVEPNFDVLQIPPLSQSVFLPDGVAVELELLKTREASLADNPHVDESIVGEGQFGQVGHLHPPQALN